MEKSKQTKPFGLYLLLAALLNAALAAYALYICKISINTVNGVMNLGRIESLPRFILDVFIMVTPLLLTIFLNRLLYGAVRGKGSFMGGAAFIAVLLVIIVQALVIYIAYAVGIAPYVGELVKGIVALIK